MTKRGHMAAVLLVAGFACAAVPAEAQRDAAVLGSPDGGTSIREVRAPEVHVHIGAFGAGSDEGRIGSGTSYGGTVDLPLRGRLAFSADAHTSAVLKTGTGRAADWYWTRRTLVMPGLVVRIGRARQYGYAGGGIAHEWASSVLHQELGSGDRAPSGQAWRVIRPGVYELTQSGPRGLKPFLKLGVGGLPISRLSVRADIYLVGWHTGARVGLGYRFGRGS